MADELGKLIINYQFAIFNETKYFKEQVHFIKTDFFSHKNFKYIFSGVKLIHENNNFRSRNTKITLELQK